MLLWTSFLLGCLFLGLITGFFAGLFGIGGGVLLIPILSHLLPILGIPQEVVLKVAVATSMATIVLTLASAAWFHWRAGWNEWVLDLFLLPGILLGGFLGPRFANDLSSQTLSHALALFFLCLSVWMLYASFQAVRPEARQKTMSSPVHSRWRLGSLSVLGFTTSAISTLAGIGGGLLMIPVLNQVFRLSVQKAIGTAAMSAVKIAILGASGYAFLPALPGKTLEYVVGSIYWPVVLPLALGSWCSAQYGTRLAHRLPQPVLKRLFAIFLVFIAFQFGRL